MHFEGLQAKVYTKKDNKVMNTKNWESTQMHGINKVYKTPIGVMK